VSLASESSGTESKARLNESEIGSSYSASGKYHKDDRGAAKCFIGRHTKEYDAVDLAGHDDSNNSIKSLALWRVHVVQFEELAPFVRAD